MRQFLSYTLGVVAALAAYKLLVQPMVEGFMEKKS